MYIPIREKNPSSKKFHYHRISLFFCIIVSSIPGIQYLTHWFSIASHSFLRHDSIPQNSRIQITWLHTWNSLFSKFSQIVRIRLVLMSYGEPLLSFLYQLMYVPYIYLEENAMSPKPFILNELSLLSWKECKVKFFSLLFLAPAVLDQAKSHCFGQFSILKSNQIAGRSRDGNICLQYHKSTIQPSFCSVSSLLPDVLFSEASCLLGGISIKIPFWPHPRHILSF